MVREHHILFNAKLLEPVLILFFVLLPFIVIFAQHYKCMKDATAKNFNLLNT